MEITRTSTHVYKILFSHSSYT